MGKWTLVISKGYRFKLLIDLNLRIVHAIPIFIEHTDDTEIGYSTAPIWIFTWEDSISIYSDHLNFSYVYFEDFEPWLI